MMDVTYSCNKENIFFINKSKIKNEENNESIEMIFSINSYNLSKDNFYINNTNMENISNNLLINRIDSLEKDLSDENEDNLYFCIFKDKKNDTLPSTDSHQKNSNESLLSKKKINDKIKLKHKRDHSKFEKDNIMRKLNIHFISFIVKFVNFNIKQLISKNHPLFANLCYNFKKKINNSTFNEMKNQTIGELLKNEGSSKNKRNIIYNKNENEKVFNSVYNTILKDLLDINFIDFFRYIYSKSSNEKFLELCKNYKIPKNILFFDDFLKTEVQKDEVNGELYKERLKSISKSEFKKDRYPFFETKSLKKLK